MNWGGRGSGSVPRACRACLARVTGGGAGGALIFLFSSKMANEWSKDDILAAYLNTIYFGHGAYGVQAAAQTYFGTTVDRLDLADRDSGGDQGDDDDHHHPEPLHPAQHRRVSLFSVLPQTDPELVSAFVSNTIGGMVYMSNEDDESRGDGER